ncbi:unnamed protein product [Tetraodon nigroviridis]|uniref:(spotted green pufferfish) hypothetical protein n=1 Tax=Tetraodon nigroviridis TaxID=99883 RepID=Q4REJ5_TETNG|nr:unnamed protein product [Tetraodon nigroviridis]
MKEEEAQGEVHDDGVHLEISELDVKQGDINSLGRFFSNIGLKLTINRGSGEKREDDNKETDKEESEKTETEKTEDKTEAEVEQDSSDPTGLILTAVAAGNVLENADERAETSEEPELDAESEQEPHSTNPTGPGDVEIDSPIRRFFATGIFSGLWKKKEAGDETIEKESEEKEDNQVPETAGQTDEEPTSPGELREEGKRRKNSSVSWEAVLCGSGRRRSRKTSDSEDEIPPIDLKQRREDGGPKSGEDSGAENGKETTAPKLDGSPQEEDRTSTWKSLKRIVTPKRKSRDEDEAIKMKTQSEGEGGQENPSFSIKNLLPGRKKQRSEESQGRASPDEAEKDRASDDDDSETPGVVPLSEFEVDEEENQSVEETEKLELQQDEETDKNLCLPQDLDEGSEKQDTNQEPDDGTELASKHQQLSVISEEGVITEPWATLASALTAAEPAADLTLQDDTEMFTAASQFSSESAKTSGNATPAPAERQAVQTETVLLQVAETFSGSPERRESSQEEGSSELAGSVSEVAFEELDSTDHTEVEDEEPPSAEEEDVQELVKELAEGLASEGGNKTGEKEIREAGDEMLTLAEANVGAGDAKQVEEPEKEGPAEGLGPPPQPQVIYGNVGKCLGTETGGEKPEQGTCLFTEVILKQEDAKSVEELRDLRAEQVSSSNHQEDNTASPEPLVISENPATAETAKDEADEADGSAEAPQEPDVLRAVQGLSSDVGEVSILYLETEAASSETSENIGVSDDTVKLQEVTGCTGLTEDSHQLVDASKTVEEPEASQAASSLASGNGDVSSVETKQKAHNILQEELVVEENKKESIIPKDTPESEEAATISEEPEAMKAAWSPALGSEEAQGLPPETQIILKADLDTDEDTKATKLMAGDACEEPVVEGRNVRMPVHPAAEESEVPPLVKEKEPVPDEPRRETILSDPKLQSVDPSESDEEAEGPQSSESAELEITPEIILTEETVPDEPKEELKHHSEITLEPEEPSETDGEAAVSQVLQQSLESEESKEEPSDSISGEETVPGEPRGETSSEPVEESKMVEAVEEPTQTVKASYWVSEDSSGSSPKAEETSEKIQRADSDPGEHKVETVLMTEEPEVSQTVQSSSGQSEDTSVPSAELEITPEIILTEETVPDEPKEELKLHSEVTLGPEEPSKTDGEAAVSQVLQQSLESEESKEEPSDNISGEETVPGEPRDETTVAGETSSEPVEESKTVEAVEEVEAVEASAVMSEDNNRSTPTTEGTSENIPTELDTAENQLEDNSVPSAEPEIPAEIILTEETVPEKLKLQTEITLEPEEPSETDGEAELEDNSVPSAEPEIPAEIILTEETVVEEAGYETSAAGETIIEPADDSKTADVVEELESVETSSLDREESSISPDEPEETPENILKTESGVDENRVETRLVTGEPPEFSQTVRSSAFESEDTSVPSAEEITSKIVLSEETVPDEPGDETAAVGEAICGQEPDENAKEHESSSPPPEAEETSDTLKAETGSEETKKEITLNPEDTESADGAEAVTAVDPTPESEHLAKEATWAHIPEEMVPGGHEEEPINDILELTQDPLVPWLESGELEVTSNNVPQAETGTVLLPDVRLKPADVQEPEVLEAVQAASFESVEANDGGQVTPEHTPKAEPEEEDLPVETTTDDPKTEQVEEDKCSGTEREPVEDEDPSALNMDTCQDVSIEEPENLRKQTSEALMHAMQAEEEVKEEVEAARPSVKGGVEEVEGGKAEDTAEEAATSERTTADSVVEVEDKGLSEEEKEQVGDQVEEKESATVQGEASHSSPVAGAKEEDEWMDAEENIQAETAGSSYEVEEPLGPQRGGEDVEQAGLERGKEAAHASRTEVEGREDMKKADEAGGFESEEEDFDIALEQPGNRSVAAAFLTGESPPRRFQRPPGEDPVMIFLPLQVEESGRKLLVCD